MPGWGQSRFRSNTTVIQLDCTSVVYTLRARLEYIIMRLCLYKVKTPRIPGKIVFRQADKSFTAGRSRTRTQ